MTDYGFQLLKTAIIRRAIEDLNSRDTKDKESAIVFFKSEWFTTLTGMDGKDVLDDIKVKGVDRYVSKLHRFQ